MTTSRAIGPAGALLVLALLASCATPEELKRSEPEIRNTADKVEAHLRSSGRLVQRPDLDAYLRRVLCRVVGERCAELRVYVVDRSGFNTRAWPNGVIEIRSGALLRIENEAQLAFVLAHEVAHYERGDSLTDWYFAGSDVTQLVEWIAAGTRRPEQLLSGDPFGYGWAGESEIDRPTLERLVAAGYDPNEAPRLWQALREERERLEATDRRPFPLNWVLPKRDKNPEIEGNIRLPVVTSHWLSPRRISELRTLAASLPLPTSRDPIGRHAYRAIVAPLRGAWLAAELHQLHFDANAYLIDRLRAAEPESGELLFFAGELHRLRDDPGDLETALALYEQARGRPDTPVELWRSLGLVAARLGRRTEARAALETYLARAPAAVDRAFIEKTLDDLGRN